MKSRTLLVAGGACLLLAAGWLAFRGSGGDSGPTAADAPASPTQAARKTEGSRSTPAPAPAKPGDSATAAKLSDEGRAAILTDIEQASVTYDAKALPQIEPYLLHPDPEIRAAAMNGMVILGDAAAGPLLRKAAESAPTPKEAVALNEAADYVELPAGTFVPKERTAPGTRKPLEGKPGERSRPKLAPRPSEGAAQPSGQ